MGQLSYEDKKMTRCCWTREPLWNTESVQNTGVWRWPSKQDPLPILLEIFHPHTHAKKKKKKSSDFIFVAAVTTIMLLILHEVEMVVVLLIKAMFTQDCTLKTVQVGSCQNRYGCFIVQYHPSCSILAASMQRREWRKQALNVSLLQTTSFFRYNTYCGFLHVSSAVWKHFLPDPKTNFYDLIYWDFFFECTRQKYCSVLFQF